MHQRIIVHKAVKQTMTAIKMRPGSCECSAPSPVLLVTAMKMLTENTTIPDRPVDRVINAVREGLTENIIAAAREQ